MPKISIIVPAFNEEKLIGQALHAIGAAAVAFTEAGFAHEVIVCDNNSTDRTAELARAAGARVVFEPVNQIARARNAGAAAATGDWLVFVDADSFPSRELFAATVRAMTDGRVAGGGAPVKLDEFFWRAWLFIGLWNSLSRLFRWAAGSYLFCAAAAFRELRGFDETLYAAEEIEFSRRLKALARSQGKRTVILRTPILTSARKLKIYGRLEMFGLVARMALRPFKAVQSRESCAMWYDGRR